MPSTPHPKRQDSNNSTSTTYSNETGGSQGPNEVQFSDDDPDNPRSWSYRKKLTLTLVCALFSMNGTFASSAPGSGSKLIEKEFGVSTEVAILVTSLYVFGYCVGPLLWAPLSEQSGRKPMFIIAFWTYTVLQIGCAMANNITTLLLCRFFSAVFSACPLTNSGGVIADIWDPVGRGTAMSIFSVSVWIGPSTGPIIGGFIAMTIGWRWIFWVMMCFAGVCALVTLIFPETYTPVLLLKKAQQLRKRDPEKYKALHAPLERDETRDLKSIATKTLVRPWVMLSHEPILMCTTAYLAFVYGLLYLFFEAFPIIWSESRGFNLGETGLIFIGIGIGTTIGGITNIHYQRRYRFLVPQWHGHPPPENRLYGAMLAGPCLVLGLLSVAWFGAFEVIPWYIPAMCTIFLGASFTLVFISFLTYVVDCYVMYASSALAANTIIRSIFGAGFPLFTRQMFEGLGVQWAGTLIGGVAFILAPIPYLFYRYGAKLRQKSDWAPCLDLELKDQVEKEAREKVDANQRV